MDNRVYFKPRARLMLELGEQLIKNESVAILELIKNSYDAFARNVKVELSNLEDLNAGKIIILDDGIGMTKDIVVNHWMEPATLNKKKLVDAAGNSKIKYKDMVRIPLGEKGIGRFGAHKLGNHICLITRSENSSEVFLEVNWNEFDNEKYLDEIEVNVYEREPVVFTDNKTGTRLEITNIKHRWTRGEFRNVYKSIMALNSPFKSDDSFTVVVNTNHDDWKEKLMSFDELKNKALYKAHVSLENSEIIEYKYEFLPWDILGKVKHRVSNDYSSKPIINLNDKKKEERIDLGAFKIGKIDIELLIFDLDSYILNLGFPADKKLIKDYLKNNGGIAIYRDNVRLYEYGEEGNDWLGLGARRINNPAKTLSSRIVVGAVYLDRLASSDLIEKTSREGFIENAAYKCFVNAVLYAISCVENDRMLDKAELRKYYSGSFKNPVVDSVKTLITTVDKKVKEPLIKKEIISSLKNIEKEYLEISQVYLKSSSMGLNMSMVIHEIDKILIELQKTVVQEGGSEHIKGLVTDLTMRISSYSDLVKNTKMQSTTIQRLVDASINTFKYRIKAHDLQIINNIFNDETEIKCAGSLVRSAIMNILDNSIYWLEKYGTEKKKIYFSIEKSEPGYRMLIIADNGKGFAIPKDKLILPFVTKKDDGMGLGLHLASAIMETMGGKIAFPDNDDIDLPDDFASGAVVALIFREG
ncbi:ATP-binding protein [Clostridium sp. Marseille-P299]|uniref:ATP-binding protein n=1 Tax=Clostridium sp. Marseille-P299 TaxID=1805477 RepID=UPI00082D54B9|nr:ATP-binding protein [Clostridium sp. Marseille-P299]